MEPAGNESMTALRAVRGHPVSDTTLLLCADVLVVCDQTGKAPPRAGESLCDAVRNAERRRRCERESHPPP